MWLLKSIKRRSALPTVNACVVARPVRRRYPSRHFPRPRQRLRRIRRAAGVIHGDFERGFIRAETIAYEDYLSCNGEQGAKDAGRMRSEGRDYLVNDADVLLFRFNV